MSRVSAITPITHPG